MQFVASFYCKTYSESLIFFRGETKPQSSLAAAMIEAGVFVMHAIEQLPREIQDDPALEVRISVTRYMMEASCPR